MRAASLLCALGAVCCGCRSEPPASPPSTMVDALVSLAAEARGGRGGAVDARNALGQLARLAARVEVDLRRGEEHPVDVLNRHVFVQWGFRREVDDPSLRHMLLPGVLSRRRGSCLGLAGLYLSLGERLGLPLRGVLAPGHFFVRYDGARRRDVELLKQGRQMPRSWYVRKYEVPPKNPLYLRSLTPAETLAVFRFNLANGHRERGDLQAALADYRRVVAALPDFAEAQANLGLTLHRLGDRRAARAAYVRARAANPRLKGLDRNLRALGR